MELFLHWNTLFEFLSNYGTSNLAVVMYHVIASSIHLQLSCLPQASRALISALTKLSPWNPVEIRLSACRFGTTRPVI
jgi:hypothetical protein